MYHELSEPALVALGIAIMGGFVAVAVLLSRSIGRRGVPLLVLFVCLGMLGGSEGLGGIPFEDYHLTFRLGTVALVFILFDGGLNTSRTVLRTALAPALVLATLGVALTAGLVSLAGRLLGLTWMEALLLGAVVSSTDAAAVFSVLRGSGVHLRQRVAATLELESGLNDPMAVILTLGVTQALLSGDGLSAALLLEVGLQLVVGAAMGVAMGFGARAVLRRPLLASGLYPVLTLAVACLAFGLPTLLQGSGFLAVYLAGLVLGNGPLPHRATILRVHDFVAWFAQVLMFVVLGLLSFPSELLAVVGPGLFLAAVLAIVARPLSVMACLLPFRYARAELAFVGWVGLRGAVPIILTTIPLMAGLEHGREIFNLVFFAVVASALVQGTSVRALTRRLGLERASPPAPAASIELTSALPLRDEIVTFFIEAESDVSGRLLRELEFPEGAAVVLIVRGERLIAPRGGSQLLVGDHASVLCQPGDRERIEALFGSREARKP